MVGIDRGWGDGSTALFSVHFDDGFGIKDPPLEPDRLPNCRPYRLVEGVWELAMAAAEAPAAALSKQIFFVPIRDQRTYHVVMAGDSSDG